MQKFGRLPALDILLLFLSFLSITGAFFYYFFSLNNFFILASLSISAVATAGFFILFKAGAATARNNEAKTKLAGRENAIYAILPILYLALSSFALRELFAARTGESIISPWQAVGPEFFSAYAVATFTLLFFLFRYRKTKPLNYEGVSGILISLHYLISFSVAAIVYKIGYGFDPFIHQATVEYIAEHGEALPKTPYYLGQYSIELAIFKIFRLPIEWIDKLLVPVLASLFLPRQITSFLKKTAHSDSAFAVAAVALLLPFSAFILTTPQNLSYIFFVVLILRGSQAIAASEYAFDAVLALACLSMHPITGIPALIFASFFVLRNRNGRSALMILAHLAMALALPLAFFAVSSKINTEFSVKTLADIPLPRLTIPATDEILLKSAYYFDLATLFIFLLLASTGFFINKGQNNKKIPILFSSALSLFISALITASIDFDFLIEYERGDYVRRIIFTSSLFLLPLVFLGLGRLSEKVSKAESIVSYLWMIILAALPACSLYLSYPRYDDIHNSRGYSVGQSDLEAVEWIEKNAESDYIVLSNQQVSAAALRNAGFKKYYTINNCYNNYLCDTTDRQVFYYPIPTGDPLYSYYLDMVYGHPSKETIKKAVGYTGAASGYFVLNKYWWAFPKIVEEAKLEASRWLEFGPGNDTYVFIYD